VTFVIALALTFFFTFGIYGNEHANLLSYLNGLNWLIAFYLFPLWVGRPLIFNPRDRKIWKYITDFIAIFGLFLVGFCLKELLNRWYAPLYQSNIMEGISIAFFWALLTTIIGRCVEFIHMWIEARSKAHKAKSEALRYQMNPHLLFNSLNSISCFIYTDPEKADFLLHQLAKLLRSSLDLSRYNVIPLSEELALLESYMSIELCRFKFEFQLDVAQDELTKASYLPPFFIQPLIENSLKHNCVSHPLVIKVKIWLENNVLCILVEDNGTGFPATVLNGERKGVGLINLQERLKATSPGSSIVHTNVKSGGASTLIRINQDFYQY